MSDDKAQIRSPIEQRVQAAKAGDLDAVLGRYPAAITKGGRCGAAPQPVIYGWPQFE